MVRTGRLLATVLSLVMLLPASAMAGQVREYQLQFSPVGATGQSLLIVTAVLDPAESLPASVTVPVPAGATLLWSGELLGSAPEDDVFREATRETVGGMDLYTFTLEQSGLAQVELALGAPTISGSRVSGGFTWTNPGDEVLVNVAVVAEPGATDVKTTPPTSGAVQENEIGETLHSLGGQRLASGGALTIEASWKRGGATDGAESPLLPLLVGGLVIAVVALVVVVARERTRARRIAASAD